MSQENAAVVREMVDAWNRGDLESVLARFHPECEVAFRREVPEPGPFHGREELRAWAEGFLGVWGTTHTELVEIVGEGRDWLVAKFFLTAEGVGSGIPTTLTVFNRFEFANGLIVRWRDFNEQTEALEAAGLSESEMSRENVELVRQIYARVSERGELALDLVASDFVFDVSDVMPDMTGVHGREDAERLFRAYADTFDDYRITLEEVIRTTRDRVVTVVRDSGRIKGSDAQVWNQFFHVCTVRDGKLVRWSSHRDRGPALEAAGLSE